MQAGLERIGESWLGVAMRDGLWLYPLVEVVHIIGFAVLIGAVTLFDLRVLGLSKGIPVAALAGHLLTWAVASLVLIVPAGLLMFASAPGAFANNPVFILKLCLIAAAGCNAALFHLGIYRSVNQWNTETVAPGLARFQALLSIGLWFCVVLCGRLLAYT